MSDEVLQREGISICESDRGGGITYHGPGQLVAYPILDLRRHGQDLHLLLQKYEEVNIRLLREFGAEAGRVPEHPGVWVGREKICALGIAVSRWVSYHGWALNICPNLEHFGWIIPCGIPDRGVTSLEKVLGRKITVAKAASRVTEYFAEVFGLDILA